VVVFFDPAIADLRGWLVAMTTRQAGHFYSEPRGCDHVNQAPDEHKETIELGYNIRSKWVLMSLCAARRWLLLDPTLFEAFEPHAG
jgi:hypothetical protein